MQLSKHAGIRAQQRGIPIDHIDIILQYGTMTQRPGQAFEIQIKKKDKDKIIQNLKKLIHVVEKCSRKAVLLDNNMETVITLYNHLES